MVGYDSTVALVIFKSIKVVYGLARVLSMLHVYHTEPAGCGRPSGLGGFTCVIMGGCCSSSHVALVGIVVVVVLRVVAFCGYLMSFSVCF